MKTIFIKTKIKENINLEEVRDWFQILRNRLDEVRQSLENESVFVESAFLDRQGEEYFLLYYMKARDIKYAYDVFNNSNLDIDIFFKDGWKKYFEGRIVLEELLDIDRI